MHMLNDSYDEILANFSHFNMWFFFVESYSQAINLYTKPLFYTTM